MYIYPLVTLFAGNFLLYLLVNGPCGKKDNSWIDVMWGISFCTPHMVIFGMRSMSEDPDAKITPRMLMATIPVFIWGFRLAGYIFVRHKKEDYRYQQMREGWQEGGTCSYLVKSLVYVYLMQGVFAVINNGSALYINLYSKGDNIKTTDYIGLAIWVAGFTIECASDY
jgi:steroid 5-alpha reductase family enzyme